MFKGMLILSLAVFSLKPLMAVEIKNVAVCAARCNTESLEIFSHGEAYIGQIYYAEATAENLTNTNFCISNAKVLDLITDRMTDESLQACADVMLSKYFGKKVNLNTETKRPVEDADLGTYFSVQVVK